MNRLHKKVLVLFCMFFVLGHALQAATKTKADWGALISAIEHGDVYTVQDYVPRIIDPTARTREGKYLFQIAGQSKQPALAESLAWQAIIPAIEQGRLDVVQAIVGRRSYSGGGYIAASAQTHGGESLITIAQDHGKANIVRYLQDQLMQSSRGASYAPPAPGPLDPLDQFSIITDATPAQWRAMREQYNAQTNPNRASIRTALTKLNQALNAGDAALQRAIVHQHAMLFNRVPMLQDALGNPR